MDAVERRQGGRSSMVNIPHLPTHRANALPRVPTTIASRSALVAILMVGATITYVRASAAPVADVHH